MEFPTIIPIAGGKGGVGKSFLTANLAAALAYRGHSTIAVDLDLGNVSLHSFLGLQNTNPGIGSYLHEADAREPDPENPLAHLLVPTSIPALKFIPGDGRIPFMANTACTKVGDLIAAIRKLPAKYVLLDLSAGTNNNTLNLFRASDYGIVVTTPEEPAFMKMLIFIKHVVLRAIKDSLRKMPLAKFAPTTKQMAAPSFTVAGYIDELKSNSSTEAARALEKVREISSRLRPRIIYNMATSPEETELFPMISASLLESLRVECDHFGMVPEDPNVRRFLSRRQRGLFPADFPDSPAWRQIDRIAYRVARYWNQPIPDSAEKLTEYARAMFNDTP